MYFMYGALQLIPTLHGLVKISKTIDGYTLID